MKHSTGFTIMARVMCCAGLCMTLLAGCAGYFEERRADRLLSEGDQEAALALLENLAGSEPNAYRLKYIRTRDDVLQALLQKARRQALQGKNDEAEAGYRRVLGLDRNNDAATAGLASLTRSAHETQQMDRANAAIARGDPMSALRSFNEVLADNPGNIDARKASQAIEIDRNRRAMTDPDLSDALRKPVTLELRDVSIQTVLEILSQTSGLNFILDKDVKNDLKTTIFAKNTSVEDALNLILRTSQLSKKVLNESTLMIYADSEEKRKRYEDLVMRTFYLKNADPKKMQEMVRALIAPRSVYVDDRLRMMIVRDNMNVIAAIERLVAAYDVADPEVVLEVEILEVNSNSILNAGIQYPDKLSASVFGATGSSGSVTVDELRNLKRENFRLLVPDPLLTLNLKETRSEAKTLANPRIRVTNRQKAKVLIGDKVPVITTTVNQTSSASTESVSYLDVGLKLEVTPEIHVNNEVTIAIELEVSNIVKEIRSSTGLLAYQIGTRNANTTLRLHDGETQVLAGLIKEDRNNSSAGIPGLGNIPGLGRIFSNQTDTGGRSEIVLLITPRIVRAQTLPSSHVAEFSSGTLDNPAVQPMRLTPGALYSGTDTQLTQQAATTGTGAGLGSVLPVLSIRLPGQVPPNADFNAVIEFLPTYESIEFDLVMDRLGVTLTGTPGGTPAAGTGIDAVQVGQTIHVKGGKRTRSGGMVATLVLNAVKTQAGAIGFSIQNMHVLDADGMPIAAAVALPAQVMVAP